MRLVGEDAEQAQPLRLGEARRQRAGRDVAAAQGGHHRRVAAVRHVQHFHAGGAHELGHGQVGGAPGAVHAEGQAPRPDARGARQIGGGPVGASGETASAKTSSKVWQTGVKEAKR